MQTWWSWVRCIRIMKSQQKRHSIFGDDTAILEIPHSDSWEISYTQKFESFFLHKEMDLKWSQQFDAVIRFGGQALRFQTHELNSQHAKYLTFKMNDHTLNSNTSSINDYTIIVVVDLRPLIRSGTFDFGFLHDFFQFSVKLFWLYCANLIENINNFGQTSAKKGRHTI